MMKQRIEWIDTAKGIVILIVVMEHTTGIASTPLGLILRNFDMPLYFVLSGIFFKTYGCFWNFVIKKTDSLLIPTFFFFWGGCFVYAILQSVGLHFVIPFQPKYLLDLFMPYEEIYCNGVVWFLIALFWVNLICYSLMKYLHGIRLIVCVIVCGLLGVSGIIHLPYFIDTALSAIPFFYAGIVIKKSGVLNEWKHDNKLLLISLLCGILLVVFAQRCSMPSNEYTHPLWYHAIALSGVFMTLAISKRIGKIPVLSTIYGRYSLIVLGTHALLINPVRRFSLVYLDGNHLFTFTVVSLLELLVVPVFIKLFPYCCAQKNILAPLMRNEK